MKVGSRRPTLSVTRGRGRGRGLGRRGRAGAKASKNSEIVSPKEVLYNDKKVEPANVDSDPISDCEDPNDSDEFCWESQKVSKEAIRSSSDSSESDDDIPVSKSVKSKAELPRGGSMVYGVQGIKESRVHLIRWIPPNSDEDSSVEVGSTRDGTTSNRNIAGKIPQKPGLKALEVNKEATEKRLLLRTPDLSSDSSAAAKRRTLGRNGRKQNLKVTPDFEEGVKTVKSEGKLVVKGRTVRKSELEPSQEDTNNSKMRSSRKSDVKPAVEKKKPVNRRNRKLDVKTPKDEEKVVAKKVKTNRNSVSDVEVEIKEEIEEESSGPVSKRNRRKSDVEKNISEEKVKPGKRQYRRKSDVEKKVPPMKISVKRRSSRNTGMDTDNEEKPTVESLALQKSVAGRIKKERNSQESACPLRRHYRKTPRYIEKEQVSEVVWKIKQERKSEESDVEDDTKEEKIVGSGKRRYRKKSNAQESEVKKKRAARTYSCSKCEFTTDKRGLMSIHSLEHPQTDQPTEPRQKVKTGKEYVCKTCDVVWSTAGELHKHTYTHTKEFPHKCKHCEYRTKWPNNLSKHVRTHTGERPYPCPQCKFRASDYSTLRRHLRVHGTDITRLKKNGWTTSRMLQTCKVCNFKAYRNDIFNEHTCRRDQKGKNPIGTHKKLPLYECYHCRFQTRRFKLLKAHVLAHLGSQLGLEPQNKSLSSPKTNSEAQIGKFGNLGEQPDKTSLYSCKLCSFKADSQEDLKKHILWHREERLREVQAVVRRMTGGNRASKIHACTKCEYKSKSSLNLDKHMKTHDSSVQNESTTEDIPSESLSSPNLEAPADAPGSDENTSLDSELLSCKLCNFKIDSQDELKRHILWHRRERLSQESLPHYECYHCGFEARRFRHLKDHIKAHITENPEVSLSEPCSSAGRIVHENLILFDSNDDEAFAGFHSSSSPAAQNNFTLHNGSLDLDPSNLVPAKGKPFSCKSSNCSTQTSEDLERDVSTQTDAKSLCKFTCEDCDFTSNKITSLQEHRQSMHSKSFECYHCDYHCNCIRSLKNHMTTHIDAACDFVET